MKWPRIVAVATESPWPVRGGLNTKLASILEGAPTRVDLVVPQGGIAPHDKIHIHAVGARARLSAASRVDSVVRGLLPSQAQMDSDATLEKILELTRDEAKVYLHFDSIATAHLMGRVRRELTLRGSSVFLVASINDSYSFLYTEARGSAAGRKSKFAGRYIERNERRYLADADLVDVVSMADIGWLARVAPDLCVRVMPLGVRQEWRASDTVTNGDVDRDVLVFSRGPGVMEFLTIVQPQLVHTNPGVRVEMVGPEPSAEVAAAARRSGVHYLGFVDDISSTVRKSRAVVAPSQQRCGLSNRALVAMQAGVAVVGGRCLLSFPGALPGREFLLGQSPAEIAVALAHLLNDADARCRIGAAGAAYVLRFGTAEEVADAYWEFVGTWASAR